MNITHFTKSGYYYTLHSNHKGTKTISYEAPMIKVIIKEENPEPEGDGDRAGLIIGLSIAGVIIICLIIFLVWYYLQKRRNKGEKYEDSFRGDEDNEKEKLNKKDDIIASNQVEEEIRKSEANVYRINA